MRVEPQSIPEPDQLAFLRALTDRLSEQLERLSARSLKHLEDARAAKVESSIYAALERDAIESSIRRIRARRLALVRAERQLRMLSTGAAPRRFREPRPYPLTRSWQALREVSRTVLDPSRSLASWFGSILDRHSATAELPFLYQRWVGVRLLSAFEGLGFRTRRDAAGPLLLGSQAVDLFDDAGRRITLWCEPRIVAGDEHPTGLAPVRVPEQSPDFVILSPGERGLEAFVLDATLSTDEDRMREKGDYRFTLAFERRRLVAGVPSTVGPERSWAAAPIESDICRLGDPDGRRGVVPVHPNREPVALAAWLGDIVERTRAWSR